jgi:uncharacterized BrkB/YihY/UPF0761 family membrane protein
MRLKVTAFLFAIGKFLIGLYLGKASAASGFGAAGSLVILLLWVYFGAQIFLLSAELPGSIQIPMARKPLKKKRKNPMARTIQPA